MRDSWTHEIKRKKITKCKRAAGVWRKCLRAKKLIDEWYVNQVVDRTLFCNDNVPSIAVHLCLSSSERSSLHRLWWFCGFEESNKKWAGGGASYKSVISLCGTVQWWWRRRRGWTFIQSKSAPLRNKQSYSDYVSIESIVVKVSTRPLTRALLGPSSVVGSRSNTQRLCLGQRGVQVEWKWIFVDRTSFVDVPILIGLPLLFISVIVGRPHYRRLWEALYPKIVHGRLPKGQKNSNLYNVTFPWNDHLYLVDCINKFSLWVWFSSGWKFCSHTIAAREAVCL